MDFAVQVVSGRESSHKTGGIAGVETTIGRIAMIGNALPRRCGIATFTTDTINAFRERFPLIQFDVWAMNDRPDGYAYGAEIFGTIDQDDLISYSVAAQGIEESGADLLWIQHEFGIFGGSAGSHILHLIDQVSIPLVVTLHTVLEAPDPEQRRVMNAIVERADGLIVMAEKARGALIEIYGARPSQVKVIPHGIPDRPFTDTLAMKARFGFGDRPVILTFGLLSPGKGIETVISALPAIVEEVPDALYVVLGATHPHLIAQQGEAYRDKLAAQVTALGVAANVRFIDAFVETNDLLDYLAAADIYATPYLNPAQITSGTLAYAVGLGKAIVSTPYVHAKELLANNHGCLVEFGDCDGFARAITSLLADPARLDGLRHRTYALGRTMIWPRLAEAALEFMAALPERGASFGPDRTNATAAPVIPSFAAIERLTDGTGMFQHSVFGVPDRAHGYCVDDNARALMWACRAPGLDPVRRAQWTGTYAAFIQHAWNPEQKLFRNFMSFDRHWLEDAGSDDSTGRTIWALGVAASESGDESLRCWAMGRYDQALAGADRFDSPRTLAFIMLGAAAVLRREPGHGPSNAVIARGGGILESLLSENCRPDWAWFEIMLAYDNCRLPEALIRGGRATGNQKMVALGIETLEWIVEKQTAQGGWFRPVGHESFGRAYAEPLPFDQQPVEAWAAIDACTAAFEATAKGIWRERALSAWRWFHGENDRGIALADSSTGECMDGLNPGGANQNRGAESVLSFQLGAIAVAKLGGLGKETGELRLAVA